MKILILEDDEERKKLFRENFSKHSLTIVSSSREAIEKLNNETWDRLYLDHDLGGEVFIPSGPSTGYEVAKWLEEHPEKKPKVIVLHSFNPTGVDNMKRCLPEAEIDAGCWFVRLD